MMNECKVAVVILNYNGQKFLEQLLPNILKNSSPHKVYVADNASTDNSVTYLENNFPEVTVIRNSGNHGYALGYNDALKQVKAEYYILLNSDVEVSENWIDPVISLMDKNKSIAASQPKLIDFNNRKVFEYAGASGGFIDKYCYPFCRGRLFNTIEEDTAQFNDSREVFWATGACLFVRSDAFWLIGGFDGDYFAHMEEIDLCWRLKNVGYQIYVEPASVVYHIGGGTLNKYSSRKTYLNFRNNLITLTKNHPSGFLPFKIYYRMVLDGVAAFRFLFDGSFNHFFAVIRAHFAYYRRLPSTLKKRRQMKKLKGFKFCLDHVYNGNIVAEYFLKKKTKFSDLTKGYLSR